MDDMAGKIKQSTVVLVQPKKLAVVLRYKMGETPLPIVSVKGKHKIAEKIVIVAKKHGIPIYTDAGLTRKLYKKCKLGYYISFDFIEPIAEVLRNVLRPVDKKQ